MLHTLKRTHICFRSSINSRVGREVWLRRGEAALIICAALQWKALGLLSLLSQMKKQRLITRVTERERHKLDHSLLGESEGGERGEEEGGRRLPGCTSPTRLQTSVCVRVQQWVFVRERETVTWKGGCYSPIFFFSNKVPWGGIWIIMTVALQLVKIKRISCSRFLGFCIALTLSLLFLYYLISQS